LYQEIGLNYTEQQTLYNALTNKVFTDIIDVKILNKFHTIRIKANRALHENSIPVCREDMETLLELGFDLAKWFVILSGREVHLDHVFVLPIEKSLNSDNHFSSAIEEFEKIKTKNQNKHYNEEKLKINARNIYNLKEKSSQVINELGSSFSKIRNIVSIDDIFLDYTLTHDQKELIIKLESFLSDTENNVFILQGYAGTGKTFITKGLTEYFTSLGRKFVLAAPTGKAAKVIKEKTKNKAFTIHKTIYSYKDLKEYKVENIDGTETFKFYFDLNDNTHDANTVYVIDEASMISDSIQEGEFFRFGSGKLLSDLMKYIHIDHNDHNKKIIFIGDTAQLPPIGMNFSPALNIEYIENQFNLKCDSYELTEIIRQNADSGIVVNSLSIREFIRRDTFNQLDIKLNYDDVQHTEHTEFLGQYLDSCDYKINGESIVIAHSNVVVDEYNSQIRKHFFPNEQYIAAGDKVIAVANNGNQEIFIYNGDFGLVKKVDKNIIKREVFVREKINDDVITTKVPLWFRKVVIGFRSDEDNKAHFFECLIFENILYRDLVYKDTYFENEINKYSLKVQDINRLEMIALYVDFVNRAKENGLKPNTEEFKQEIKKDIYFNALKIKFGYALTCHKAQGSEWNNVFVNSKTHQTVLTKDYFRWLYTAITRSSKKLYLMDEPHLTMFEGLGELTPLSETEPNMGVSESIINFIEEKVKEVCKIVDVEIKNIQHHQYLELYTFNKEDKIQRVQIYYNGQNRITRLNCVKRSAKLVS
jgi:hypothetical protein